MPERDPATPAVASSRRRRPHGRLGRLSPDRLLLLLAALVFVSEFCAMLLIAHLPEFPAWVEALIDATMLLTILSPSYFLLYRPFWQERQRAEAEIRCLSRQLIRAEEATRKALARDLHDEFGQLVCALQLGTETLKNSLPAGQENLFTQCQRLSSMVAQLGAHLRDVTAQLRPAMLDSLGLAPTVRWQAGLFREMHPGMQVELELPEQDLALLPEAAIALFRVFQESLSNVDRHADASRLRIALQCLPAGVLLSVEDDGRGFDPEVRPQAVADGRSGIGIPGMRERLADLGGALTIRSRPGEGTVVRAELPLAAAEE